MKAIRNTIAMFIALLIAFTNSIFCNALNNANYIYEVNDGNATLRHITADYGDELIIPDKVDGYTVTALGSVFAECHKMKKISMPDSIVEVGFEAFRGCSELESVKLSKSLKVISASMFEGCTSLKRIEIPQSVTAIADSAFFGCISLEIVVIPVSVARIVPIAFEKCTSIKDVYYEGTEEQWKVLEEKYSSGNEFLFDANIHYRYCYHGNTIVVPAVDATTEYVGYTEGVYCNDCKKYISGHIEIEKKEADRIIVTETEKTKNIGNVIICLLPGTSVLELAGCITNMTKIVDSSGKEVVSSDAVKSGMEILLYSNLGIVDKKIIVVAGDNDGDGKISAADARTALRASVSLESLNDWQKIASDVDADVNSAVTASDARCILRLSVGLDDIIDCFEKM